MLTAGLGRLRSFPGSPGGELSRLVPIILPLVCLRYEWPGPIVRIGDLPFAAAWAVIPRPNSFAYVTHGQAADWQARGIDWRKRALDNLVRLSKGRRSYAGYKNDECDRPYWLSLLHPDAFGPSRLLVPHLFDDILGPGYSVAIPEQSCAIAYRAELTRKQRAEVDALIAACFRDGTEPMCPEHFDGRRFWAFAADRPSASVGISSVQPEGAV